MNLRGCEQCESSKGLGAGVLEPRGGQGLRKSCSCVPRACGEEPAAHAGFGAHTSQTFIAKFRPGIPSQQPFGKRRGSLRSSAGCQQPARRVPSPCAALFGVMDIPRGQCRRRAGWAGPPASRRAPEGSAGLSPAATQDQRNGTPAASLPVTGHSFI